jgi:hypothetical protein
MFSIDFADATAIGCLASITFYDRLLFNTLVPLSFVLVISVVYFLTPLMRALNYSENSIESVQDYCFQAATLIVNFSYPGINMSAMQTLSCREIEGVWYLKVDYQIQCYDVVYWRYALYSILILLCCAVGWPLLVGMFLYRNRENLADLRMQKRIGHLYDMYEPKTYYWFECVEMLRKLLLPGVVGMHMIFNFDLFTMIVSDFFFTNIAGYVILILFKFYHFL